MTKYVTTRHSGLVPESKLFSIATNHFMLLEFYPNATRINNQLKILGVLTQKSPNADLF
jgi:hypothetical protein